MLVAWAGITMLRRMAERRETDRPHDRRADAQTRSGRQEGSRQVTEDNGIDYEELERAEREMKDLDATTRPEDGFEGDDWGPGAGPKPPLIG
mgnify:CR=1 FL=1